MAEIINKILVAQISTSEETYYICHNIISGITLDGIDYLPLLLNVSDAERYGNFGDGSQVGTISCQLINGSKYYQGNTLFDLTSIWNNKFCDIRLCDVDNDISFSDCISYYSGIIKNFEVNATSVNFDVDNNDYKNDITLPLKTVEDVVSEDSNLREEDIPKDSAGKRIPIQIGSLNDPDNGIFARGILISNRIGNQIIQYDTEELKSNSGVGIWDETLNRFYIGKADTNIGTTTIPQGEYEIIDDNRQIKFNVDSRTRLSEDVEAIQGINTITVENWARLFNQWVNESYNQHWQSYPELLTSNIIAIDNELMQIIEEPSSQNIKVQRGYDNTTVAAHSANSIIYSCSKYSGRNLLSFTEKFTPVAITNQWAGQSIAEIDEMSSIETTEIINAGSWDDLIDNDTSTYLDLKFETNYSTIPGSESVITAELINFDVIFERIDFDARVTNVLPAIKINSVLSQISGLVPASKIKLNIFIWNVDDDTNYNEYQITTSNTYFNTLKLTYPTLTTEVIDTYSSISRDNDTLDDVNGLFVNYGNDNNILINEIDFLNKKNKISIQLTYENREFIDNNFLMNGIVYLYNFGYWVDFFVKFDNKPLIALIEGRTSANYHDQILSYTYYGYTIGDALTTPVPTLINLLVNDMGYSVSQFDTDSWDDAFIYQENDNDIYTDQKPTIAMSYGIDDSKNGWELCQEIASHFLLSLMLDQDKKLKLVNLHKLQNTNVTFGYPIITASQISLDDVIIPGDNRNIKIMQTGTDKIINDVIIKYNRNNSNNNYQSSYRVPDTYTLPISGYTLSEARNIFYNGRKTKTLEIEAFDIYNEYDAKRLAEWHINEKAEVHFWAEFTIVFDHYNYINSLSKQYSRGDIIYFDGNYSGIVLDSNRKFVINNVKYKDNGKEIELQCRSIEPVTSFTTTSSGQHDKYINTYNSTDILQDTYDNTTIYQDI